MPEERRLPPFPDWLIDPAMKEPAIGFIRGLEAPARISRSHLARWAEVVGVKLTPLDFKAVSSKRRGEAPIVYVTEPPPVNFVSGALSIIAKINLAVDTLQIVAAMAGLIREELEREETREEPRALEEER